MEHSVSANVWIPHPGDLSERINEALVRVLIGGMAPQLDAETRATGESWLNPGEECFPCDENLELLNHAIMEASAMQLEHRITATDVAAAVCDPSVVRAVRAALTARISVSASR